MKAKLFIATCATLIFVACGSNCNSKCDKCESSCKEECTKCEQCEQKCQKSCQECTKCEQCEQKCQESCQKCTKCEQCEQKCQESCQKCQNKCNKCMKGKFVSKYTNADFYKDGVFQEEVAKQAFIEMFNYYDYPITEYLKENWWFIDFGLGDFEHCGMGGVFWVNDPDYGYFAHDIYLLPNQMLPEHKHVPTKFPVKMESWMVRNGWAYNFSEVGDATPGWEDLIPESQKATTVSKHYVRQNVGDVIHLRDAGEQTWHFLRGGDEGAIVHEWARYHDGTGNRYTNTKAKM